MLGLQVKSLAHADIPVEVLLLLLLFWPHELYCKQSKQVGQRQASTQLHYNAQSLGYPNCILD